MHVPVETDLPRHPKTEHFREILKLRTHEAVGYLVCLWIWATEFAEDGYVGDYPDKVVSKGAGWRGLPGTFLGALRESRWISESGHLHAWETHVGRCLISNKKAAERMKKLRERSCNVRERSGEKEKEKEKDIVP